MMPGSVWEERRPRIEYRGTIFGKNAKKEAVEYVNAIARARHVLVLVEIDSEHYEIWLDYVESD